MDNSNNGRGSERRKRTRPKRLNSVVRARGSLDDASSLIENLPVENEQEPQVESANVDPLQETTDAQQDQTVNLQKISKSKERLSSESDTELQERRDQAKRDHQKYLEDYFLAPFALPIWPTDGSLLNPFPEISGEYEIGVDFIMRPISPRTISTRLASLEEENNDDSDNSSDESNKALKINMNMFENVKHIPRISINDLEYMMRLGNGGFGTEVWHCRKRDTNQMVALKRFVAIMKCGWSTAFQKEIEMMLSLDHKNIIKMIALDYPQTHCDAYIFFPYIDYNVELLITSLRRNQVDLLPGEIKGIMHQLFTGLNYLHDKEILHSNLKPASLLLSKDLLKVCDFGCAHHEKNIPVVRTVGTQFYRAPELLLQSSDYDIRIDIWSAGCILGELLIRRPLFPGESLTSQIDKIFRVLGTPNRETWPDFENLKHNVNMHYLTYPHYLLYQFFMDHHFELLSEAGFGLLEDMLKYNPEDRPTAKDALEASYFSETPRPIMPDF